jgi:hypothetical protein
VAAALHLRSLLQAHRTQCGLHAPVRKAPAVCFPDAACGHAGPDRAWPQPCNSRLRRALGASDLHVCMCDAVGPLCIIVCPGLLGSRGGEDARACGLAVSASKASGSGSTWCILSRCGVAHAAPARAAPLLARRASSEPSGCARRYRRARPHSGSGCTECCSCRKSQQRAVALVLPRALPWR